MTKKISIFERTTLETTQHLMDKSPIEKITKEQLNAILKDIYEDVDNLGASSVRYWIIRHMRGEAAGSKQGDYYVQEHVIEKVIGSAVREGKYIYVRRDQRPNYDFSIQRNPNLGFNRTLKFSNILTTIILAITCYFIALQACHEVKPKSESTVTSIKRMSDTTKTK